jgi:hypothetical protein
LAGVSGYGKSVAIGAIASHLGGGSAGMGAFSAVFEYLYNEGEVRLNSYQRGYLCEQEHGSGITIKIVWTGDDGEFV